ncbi:ABC transporter ATP-binding protein [Jannaschia rubra]|uniref:ABC transporter ATP-binding protein n=1 Tax=Jannaschia rubra TaxID=282197 RepID=UPI002490FBCA|nr:ABC transporter ATP-binding protein [Jannaschia rubra]
MADTLLSIRDLRLEGRAERGWVPILKGVDLDLKRGEVLGLIGESGAGKSTLGLAAMGYVRDGTRFAGGSVTFDGRDLLKLSPRERRRLRGNRIAYVAQSAAASFNPAHRLIDQYSEGPVIHGVMSKAQAEADARELYAKMRLPDPDRIGFRYPHQVSGGQLQRAMTAMAMASRPDLIIFDEPTTALDVTTQIEVLGAIRDIVAEFDTAAIYITHDLAVVAQMADRIKVMRHGEEVEEAPTREMLAAPREDYTRSLWAVREFRAVPAPAPAPDEKPVLSVSHVTASYRTGPAVLQDVTFDIHPGRTLAVVGESGSGKSTAARVITGLLPPDGGEIRLGGEVLPPRLADRSREQLRRVQMIYQMADTALNPRQTLREIVGRPARFYRGLRGRDLDRDIRQLLEDVELDPDEFIDRYPGELSGGQKQRVGILRALAARPDVIICDEVTSALDQIVADGILRLLKRLQVEHGLSYMFITHDIATVRAIADHVVVMQNGHVVEQGPKAEMFAPPHAAYTDLLLSSVPEMDPDWLTRRRGEMRA